MSRVRPNDLSKSEALATISQFLTQEWNKLQEEDIIVTRAQSGVNNDVYFVSRVTENGIKEPNKLVFRKYNSISSGLDAPGQKPSGGMRATPVEQIIMMTAIADRGLGPRIYGVFDEGRIEEFVDCRMITLQDARDPLIEADIAKNLARIHATFVPLPKPAYRFTNALGIVLQDVEANINFFEALGDEALLKVVKHDFRSDLDMLEKLMNASDSRIVLMNWDPHLDNIAIRNNPAPDQLKTIIFDFENASCNVRDKDLGLFLISRSGYFPPPFLRQDRRLESNEEFSSFLRAYQREIEQEFDDVDINGKDSIDNLMIQSLTGGMISCLCFLFLIARVVGMRKDPGTASPVLQALLEGFMECKSALKQRFPSVKVST